MLGERSIHLNEKRNNNCVIASFEIRDVPIKIMKAGFRI